MKHNLSHTLNRLTFNTSRRPLIRPWGALLYTLVITPKAWAIYDFNALIPSPTRPGIAGQDGWEVSTWYGSTSVPSNGAVKTAWGADGTQAIDCNAPTSPSGTQMSRPNDASLGMPSFTGPAVQAIETDIRPQYWGVLFGVGYDNNANGKIDVASGGSTEIGVMVQMGQNTTNQWKAGANVVNFTRPFYYQWGRIRMIIDTAANGGQGKGCLLYKLPYNAATWTPVTAIQQVNLNLNPVATDARAAIHWNRVFFACAGISGGGLDNISFESITLPSDITLSNTAVAENSPANTLVGSLSVTPASSHYLYSLVAGTGDTDNGSFTLTGTDLQLIPSPDYETKNSYSLRVRVSRDDSGSCVAPFEKALVVTITNLNDNTPTVTNASVTTNEDTAYLGTLPVGNDIDGDALTYSLVSDGTLGTATIANTGTFRYQPYPNVFGTDSFTFKVNDGVHDSSPATVTVTTTPVNDSPSFTANNPPAVNRHSEAQTLTQWATFNPGPNETDNVLTYLVSNVTNPALFNSLPSVDNNGTLTYSLTGQAGDSNFNVRVQDTGGTANGGIDLSTASTFTLTVTRDPQTLIFTPLTAATVGAPPQTLSGTATSGLPVTFASLTPSVCTVSGDQLIFSREGMCTVAANQSGDQNYQAAPQVVQEMEISPVIQRTLHIKLAGTGQGSVTSDPVGLDCSATTSACALTFKDLQWVHLTTTPATGSQEVKWSGDPACTKDGPGKVFLLSEETTCTATFDLKNYTLTVERNVPGITITGDGLNCQDTPDGFRNLEELETSTLCQASYPYGTTVKLQASATPPEWEWVGWGMSCDSQGQVVITQDRVCRARYQEDPKIPNGIDGNGDGINDAHQPNVMSLADKMAGSYITLVVNPECTVADGSTVTAEMLGKVDSKHRLPQGLMTFELQCSQATVTMYFHGFQKLLHNLEFRKYGPQIPGDPNTVGWYKLPNVTFNVVMVGGKPVVTASYTLMDGQLGDSTGVDGRIVDPVGLGLE